MSIMCCYSCSYLRKRLDSAQTRFPVIFILQVKLAAMMAVTTLTLEFFRNTQNWHFCIALN